ncbi:MAG TPA: DUF309 domain-containing protein [Thermoplasmata archaeon]|nr:DUF309 domain-containing protein [Thermoplasmata archaeon]
MDVELLLDQGIDLFNRRYFFEAHDVWEEIWRGEHGPMKNFFKGLIHLAGGFHHFTNGNFRGAAALLTSGTKYLTPYAPGRMGIDLAAVLPTVGSQLDKIVRLRDGVSEREDIAFPTITRTR